MAWQASGGGARAWLARSLPPCAHPDPRHLLSLSPCPSPSAAVELLAAGPDVEVVLPPPTSPDVLDALSRCLGAAVPPVLAGLQATAQRGEVERSLWELLRTLRLVGPLPGFKVRLLCLLGIFRLPAAMRLCPHRPAASAHSARGVTQAAAPGACAGRPAPRPPRRAVPAS